MKSVTVTFYESPEGGKRVRRLAKTQITSSTLLGVLDSVRGNLAKASDEMVERVSRITVDVSQDSGTWEGLDGF